MTRRMLKILLVVLFVSGCNDLRQEKFLQAEVTQAKEYIEWLGERSRDMTIGGDTDAYRTLKWAKDQKHLTKEKMEEHYKEYQKKREDEEFCKGDDSTLGWKRHCEGYWHTMTFNGKIYNCLGQMDYGKMYNDDICYQGFKYACHVNSENITEEKIEKSCKFNHDLDNKMTEINKEFDAYVASGGDVFSGIASYPIPKRMEKQ